MGVQTRLLTATIFTLSIFFLGLEYLSYRHSQFNISQEARRTAEQIRGILMATRRVYHNQFINSGIPLTDETVGFLPAHALSKISREFSNWGESGLSFNNVSDRPRNPANMADATERAAMQYFRDNPEEEILLTKRRGEDGSHYYHYTRPIRIESYCLHCHGKRQDAPETIRNYYDTGYDYELGDLRGVMSIKIPESYFSHHFFTHFMKDIKLNLAVFTAIFLLLVFFQYRLFFLPIRKLNHGIQAIAAGNHDERISGLAGEFQQIGETVNHLAAALSENIGQRERAERQYRLLMESANDAIFVADVDTGTIIDTNQMAARLLGQPVEKIIGLHQTRLHPADKAESYRRIFQSHIQQGEGSARELHVQHRDGRLIPVEVRAAVADLGDRRVIQGFFRDISNHRQAEAELRNTVARLRENQERMYSLLASTGEAIFGLDLDGRCTFSNPACLKLLGFDDPTQMLGKNVHALIHHHRADGTPFPEEACRIHQAVNQGVAIHVDDEVFWRRDATAFQVEYRAHPIMRNDRLHGAVVTFTDITNRIAAHNALRRTSRALNTLNRCNRIVLHADHPDQLLNQICEMIVRTDGYLLAWVGLAEEGPEKRVRPVARFGLDALNKPDTSYLDGLTISWADDDLGSGPTGTAIREGRTVAIRDIHRDPDFEPWRNRAVRRRYASSLACPLKDGDHTFGALNIYSSEANAFDDEEIVLLTTLSDNIAYGLHSLKDAADKRQAEEALRASEEKLRTLLHHSPDLIVTFDRQGNILFHNRPPPDHLARPFSESARSRCRTHLCRVFDTRQPIGYQCSTETSHWWEIRLAPILQGDRVQSVMAVFTDITEQRTLQAQAIHSARLASLGELSAGVAHEINNPNNAIQFNESIISEIWRDAEPFLVKSGQEQGNLYLGGIPLEEAREAMPKLLGGVRRGAQRIATIIDNLKRMARKDTGNLEETVDILDVLESTLSILQNQIVRHTNHCTLNPVPPLPPVRGNAQQLEQVFINLVINALQALPDRDRGVEIAAKKIDADHLEVTVSDQGVGISPENLHKLTNPFFTTRTGAGGTGLGLSISKTIVQNHQGQLIFESRVGKGTRATVRLPVKNGNDRAAHRNDPPARATNPG